MGDIDINVAQYFVVALVIIAIVMIHLCRGNKEKSRRYRVIKTCFVLAVFILTIGILVNAFH